MNADTVALPPAAGAGVPVWITRLLAVACGLIVANIYYAQPLVGPISAALGLAPGAAGLIVTMTQVGYGVSSERMHVCGLRFRRSAFLIFSR